MILGFDFELSENRRRSENYVRPAYDPYPTLETGTHVQNPIPENETHVQNLIPENETHAQNPIPENETHAPNPISENKSHAQNPIPEKGIIAEKIDAEWSAIYSMLKVAHICEDVAKRYRNLGDFDMEECYLIEAHHAQEAANLLYILTHK